MASDRQLSAEFCAAVSPTDSADVLTQVAHMSSDLPAYARVCAVLRGLEEEAILRDRAANATALGITRPWQLIEDADVLARVLPAWTRAPGSPDGLAALAAIARELGWAWNATYQTWANRTVGIEISYLGWRERNTGICYDWCDQAALVRLLHLLLALRPAT